MIGTEFWSTGVKVSYLPHRNEWSATVEFFDDGFCEDESTQGRIGSRYFAPLETVLDNVIRDAEKLGIVWRDKNIFVDGDGEGVTLPRDWREIIQRQADRIGFRSSYTSKIEFPAAGDKAMEEQ
jgi:hypothetical protein